MRRHFIFAVAAVLAVAGCGRGQTNPRGVTASGDMTATPVTIIGCLVPGGSGTSAGAVGTAGNTEATGFTLIDTTTTATPASDTASGSAASGAAGTSPAPASAAANGGTAAVDTGTPRSYSLIGGKQDELQKFANSRVEVRGAVVASTDTGLGVPDAGAASAPAGTPATAVERVRVDHVTQLDANCSIGSHR
jgi:hypothetical protein